MVIRNLFLYSTACICILASQQVLAQGKVANGAVIYLTEAYRDGGSFEDYSNGGKLSLESSNSTNFIVSKRIDHLRTFEFIYSYQETSLERRNSTEIFDVDISYYHLGGTNQFLKNGNTEIYGLGGVGATYFSPDSGFSSETRFSLSLGLGAKHDLGENFVLRADLKFYGTLLNKGSGIFCGGGSNGGGCSVAVSGSMPVQYEAGIGLGYKF